MMNFIPSGNSLKDLGDSRKAASVPAAVKVTEWMKNIPMILAPDDNICFLECYPGYVDDDSSYSDSLLTDFTDNVVELQSRKITKIVRQMYMAEPEPFATLPFSDQVSYSQESYGDCADLSVFYGIKSQPGV